MKLIRETSPYIRRKANVARMMIDVLIALLPVVVFAIIKNGMKSVSVIAISLVSMILLELLCVMFIKWPEDMKIKELFSKEGFKKLYAKYTINNITAPAISAIIYAMILPAGTNWYVVLVGAVAGIVLGKMLFGGLGSNIFNPAAVGRVFVGLCFGSQLVYNNGGVDVAAGGTPLNYIANNLSFVETALENYTLKDMFLGNIPGSMGEVSALMILIGGAYLFARRYADFRPAAAMVGSFAVITLVVSFVTASVSMVDPLKLFAFEMLSGGLLFGAIYMVTDPVTSPTTKIGRIIYGVLVGSLTALIRYAGAYPEGVAFSILIANMFVAVIDHFLLGNNNRYSWKHAVGITVAVSLLCLILGFTVANKQGSNQIKEYKYEMFEAYDKAESESTREFSVEQLKERIDVKDENGNLLGYLYTVRTYDAWGSLTLLVGINKDNTLNDIKIITNNQDAGVVPLIETHIDQDYVSGITVDQVKELNLDLFGYYKMVGENIKAMVVAAFADCGGAQ